MFSLTRKEQIALSVLSGALVVGAAISYWDARHPEVIQEFRVVRALEPPAADSSEGASRKVDLNRATARVLEQLPGIGPTMAARIVAWREHYGPFRSVDDLKEVRGIGEKTFAGLAPLVEVREATPAKYNTDATDRH